MTQARYIAADSETTGLDPLHTAIIELGATILDEKLQPVEDTIFHCFIQPPDKARIEAQAIKINGHTWVHDQTCETFKNALLPAKAWADFVAFLRRHFGNTLKPAPIIVGWNPSFDEGFLKQLYRAYLRRLANENGMTLEQLQERPLPGHGWPLHYHKIDGIGIARWLDICTGTTRKSYGLANLRKELCPEGPEWLATKYGASHGALADVFAMLDVLGVMTTQHRHNVLDEAVERGAIVGPARYP